MQLKEKVKIFTRGFDDTADRLENEINEWIEKNPNIQIISIHTTGGISGRVVNLTVLIRYLVL